MTFSSEKEKEKKKMTFVNDSYLLQKQARPLIFGVVTSWK